MKFCECGCGQIVPPAKRARPGYRRGESARFLQGHNYNKPPLKKYSDNGMWKGGRVDRIGYIGVKQDSGKYKLEHILMVEKVLGKPLPPGAVVHHHNKNRSDNRHCNLVLCDSNAYHLHLHKRQRAYEKGKL